VELTYVGEEHGIYALTDSEQITQVFNNLIKNALQAVSTQTGGRVKVNISSLAEWVSINVIDNGVGIPEDIRDKIFMPNFTTKSTGMGLGLAICKKIVEGSGGKISFACTNRETTFTIELRKAGKDSDNHADAPTVQ
ncbi:MAG: ATP-binding protein, partial [Paludibacteraceae bacterium]|nr:ATP-binding protein [Paludibacteraceae bacterium]